MSDVASREGHWTAPSSASTYAYRIWHPDATRALVVLVHGFGEHAGRYGPFATALARQGICVAAPDLWGHGRSGGQRGDLPSLKRLVQHLSALAQAVFVPHAGMTRYALFGHSFGGLVAIQWALEHPAAVDRLIVQSPLLEVGFPIPWWEAAGAACCAVLWPRCAFSMNLDVHRLSHDPAVVQAYQRDPLVHHWMTARAYHETLRARDEALARAATVRQPVLLLCGGEDRIVSVEAAERWLARVPGPTRCVKFPHAYHELHHEDVNGDVLRLVSEWVLPPQGAGTS